MMRPNSLIIIRSGNTLLAQKGIDETTGSEFYRLLGGGIDFGETSSEAARREIKEELGVTLVNEQLLTVIENIFEFNGILKHEITFLYKGDIREKEIYGISQVPIIDKNEKFAEWVSVEDVQSGKVKLFPNETVNFI